MLLQQNFWYCVLRFWGFNLFLYNYVPSYMLIYINKSTIKHLMVFLKKSTCLMFLWKSFFFSYYRRNALRARLNLYDIHILLNSYLYKINWVVGFPAYMHLHFRVVSDTRNETFEYGVTALWIYTQAQLSSYIVSEYLKACGLYKTQNICALFLDYLFFRKL